MSAQSDTDTTGRRRAPAVMRLGRRGHLPLRIAPMLLVGMILLVLGVISIAVL